MSVHVTAGALRLRFEAHKVIHDHAAIGTAIGNVSELHQVRAEPPIQSPCASIKCAVRSMSANFS